MNTQYRVIKTDSLSYGIGFTIHNVSINEDGEFILLNDKIAQPQEKSAESLGQKLVNWSEAMLKPVLEVVQIDGKNKLVEAKEQPDRYKIPQSDHWRKAVLYKEDKKGKVIDHGRKGDKLYWIKIRDYLEPIAAYKAEDNVEFPFFYVRRGDNQIVATYWASQVTQEALLETPF